MEQLDKDAVYLLAKGILLSLVDPKNEYYEDKYKSIPEIYKSDKDKEEWAKYKARLARYDSFLESHGMTLARGVHYDNSVCPTFILIKFDAVRFLKDNGVKDVHHSQILWDESEDFRSGVYYSPRMKAALNAVNEMAELSGFKFIKEKSGSTTHVDNHLEGKPLRIFKGVKEAPEEVVKAEEGDSDFSYGVLLYFDTGKKMSELDLLRGYPHFNLQESIEKRFEDSSVDGWGEDGEINLDVPEEEEVPAKTEVQAEQPAAAPIVEAPKPKEPPSDRIRKRKIYSIILIVLAVAFIGGGALSFCIYTWNALSTVIMAAAIALPCLSIAFVKRPIPFCVLLLVGEVVYLAEPLILKPMESSSFPTWGEAQYIIFAVLGIVTIVMVILHLVNHRAIKKGN